MIIALGIDSVEISRFAQWHTFSEKRLSRVFSPTEIDYCLEIPIKSAERFAARFTAKEAFFKALRQAYPEKSLNLLTCLTLCQIIKSAGAPTLSVDWNALQLPELGILLSVTHTRIVASATVILQKL